MYLRSSPAFLYFCPKSFRMLFAYLIVVNFVAFVLYGVDKRRAIRKLWRIPESVLMGVAAIGGSVGALIGMLLFRHKTKHAKFTVGVPLILVIQVVAIICFYR